MVSSVFPGGFNKQLVQYRLPLNNEIFFNVEHAPAVAGESPTYRNKLLPGSLYGPIHPELDTQAKLFNNAVRLYGDKPCLGARNFDPSTGLNGDYESLTYSEVNERKQNLGSGILHALTRSPFRKGINKDILEKILHHAHVYHTNRTDIRGRENTDLQIETRSSFIVSIFSANRPEWVLADLACGAYSMTNTALYDNLGSEVTIYLLELTRSPCIIALGDKIELLLQFKEKHPSLVNLIVIILMDPVDQRLVERAEKLQISLFDFAQVQTLGAANFQQELPPYPNTLFTVSFTSGTTGSKPKGVMLTHSNAVAAITGLMVTEPNAKKLDNARAFIFLPLTHIYERQTLAFAWSSGFFLGFPQISNEKSPQRDPFTKLVEDLRIFKPTYFLIVPRLLTKLETFIKLHIESLPQRDQINEIVKYKLAKQAEKDGETGASEYDQNQYYASLRKLVGFDNLLWTQTASAPVSPSTLIYVKASLGIGVRQLYGMTETYGAMTSGMGYEGQPGGCGAVFPGNEFKLVARGDTSAKTGELLVRGAAIFAGYYHNLSETLAVINEDGWVLTGDVATVNPDTFRVSIVDRVKNFFKLSQGEYVLPEKVENRYLSLNTMITQLYVHGDSLRSFLVGIVGIDHESGVEFLKKQGITHELTPSEMIRLINLLEHKKVFLRVLNANIVDKLNGIEKLHNIHIDVNPLTVEKNVVTPTFKIKRGVAAKYFKDIFHHLYETEKSLLKGREKL